MWPYVHLMYPYMCGAEKKAPRPNSPYMSLYALICPHVPLCVLDISLHVWRREESLVPGVLICPYMALCVLDIPLHVWQSASAPSISRAMPCHALICPQVPLHVLICVARCWRAWQQKRNAVLPSPTAAPLTTSFTCSALVSYCRMCSLTIECVLLHTHH